MGPKLTVWYNTRCPVCNAGIDRQRNRPLAAARAGLIEFGDINLESEALARFGASLAGTAARGIGRRREPDQRLKTSEKLFAGIATISGAANPCFRVSSATASMSRTPQAGSLRRRSSSNVSLLGAVCRPSRR